MNKTSGKIKGFLFAVGFLSLLSTLSINKVYAKPNSADSYGGDATVRFKASDDPTSPVDPENPEKKPEIPEPPISTTGPLRFDLLPVLRFGKMPISDKDQVYHPYAQLFKDDTPARGNYLQVTDNRGSNAGWEVSVKQERQFTSESSKELKGLVISFKDQWANSTMEKDLAPNLFKDIIEISEIGSPYPVAKAPQGKGTGTWTIEFGASEDVGNIKKSLVPELNADGTPLTDPVSGGKPLYRNQAISLSVPGKTKKEPEKYTTVLTWTLSELP